MVPVADTSDSPIDALLDYLKRTRGFDFSGYKRTSLERRIAKRMAAVGVEGYLDYLDYLEANQDEVAQLFDTILINVTGFFRDAPAWDYLSTEILPRLLDSLSDDQPLRVWCAGCSSGEETYTMAIVLGEVLGEQAYARRVKIYATDVDEHALSQARHGIYDPKAVESVSPELLDRYFERVDRQYAFRKDLRRTVVFGRNDLVQDAPISRIDLLTCRNTLMYFNAETQARILSRFHFALNGWGYLFLGRSEMLITHGELFRPVNLNRRVFTKVVKARSFRDRLLTAVQGAAGAGEDDRFSALRDDAFDASPVAQVVIDGDGTLALANAAARALFGLGPGDLGRPLQDLELSYRPVELRGNVERAHTERRTVAVTGVTATLPSGEVRELEVQVVPLALDSDGRGATIVFQDVTVQHRAHDELQTSKRELENVYEELQSTVEELETTNEELQSTNEELETTNEELQSSTEELETMNEELQSTNEELQTINDELRERTHELNEVNDFLETILTSMGMAVVVVDHNQTVRVWNAHSTELWGLRPDEAEGKSLFGLDIGLPVDGLRDALRAVLAGREERTVSVVEATNRRGRSIRVRVSCLPMKAGADGAVTGAVVTAEELLAPAENA
jgi:two-component system, chemotaxis family, CheB/CheR fusion protein